MSVHYLSRANALFAAALAQDLRMARERVAGATSCGDTQEELIRHLQCAEIAAVRWLAEIHEGDGESPQSIHAVEEGRGP